MNATKRLIMAGAALLLLAMFLVGQGPTVSRGPYLQMGTPSTVVVRWRTNTTTDSVVRYGTSPGTLTSTASVPGLVTEHIVPVAGLAPGATYYYSIGTTSGPLAGDATYHFITAPATGSSRPTRIWVIGDSGTGNASAMAVRNAYTTFTGSRYTDLWLMLGDNAYNSGTDSEFQTAVFNMYPSFLRQTVLWPTLGNHDGMSADSASQSGPYYDIFSLPAQAEAGGLVSGTEAYYSFDYGNMHFVCLESYETNRSAGSPMMTWLQNDVAATNKPWIIAFWHHPPYTKGSHNSDTEIELIEMRQNALPILEAAGVDLVLTGHSHSYERSFLIDGHYGVSTTFTSAMKIDGDSGRENGTGAYHKPVQAKFPHAGAVYAVAGSSGQISGGTLNHPAMFISLNTLGSMVLDVDGGRLDAKFLDSNGATPDSFTILKDLAAPSAPLGLSATAVSSSQINLAWTDNSSNEQGFKIERSTDNVNFSPIATVGAGVVTYQNTGLSPSTLFYYRVRAYNATGNSGYSNVANATTQTPPATPAAPSGLTAQAASNSQINLAWTDNANNETGFKIERSTNNANAFSQIATVGANVKSYSNTGLAFNTRYYYRVRAYNGSGDSGYSNTANTKTPRK